MRFVDILNGWHVFIDANILIYYAAADATYGDSCKQLMERIARREIVAYTLAHVLADLAHRVMTLEAMAQFGWPAKAIANRLRQHPADLQKLTRSRQAVADIPLIGIRVVPVDFDLISIATAVSQQHGLLTGDALVVAVMQRHGLTYLASKDTDFDRVPGISRYGPA